jgi:hypothetical protein
VEDARPLDELANDLAGVDMLYDDTLHTLWVYPIIQRSHATRARQGRKASPQCGCRLIHHQLAYEDVRPLRTAPEAALPGQLRAFARTMSFQRRPKHVV